MHPISQIHYTYLHLFMPHFLCDLRDITLQKGVQVLQVLQVLLIIIVIQNITKAKTELNWPTYFMHFTNGFSRMTFIIWKYILVTRQHIYLSHWLIYHPNARNLPNKMHLLSAFFCHTHGLQYCLCN